MQPIGENTAAVADVLPHVEALLALHREAMQTLSRAFGERMNRPDECVLLLGVHAYNLSDGLFRLILAGRFDLAAYLLRPAWDIGGLILGVGSDEEMAERFWAGNLKASEARIAVIEAVRSLSGDDLADQMTAGWRDDYDPLQELAHVRMIHLDKSLAAGPTGNVLPVMGGRASAKQTSVMLAGALKAAVQSVVHLYAVRGTVLGADFHDRALALHDEILAWVKSPPD